MPEPPKPAPPLAARRLSLAGAAQRWWRRQGSGLRSEALRNERLLYVESIFQALADAGLFSFWGVFLVRLGSPEWLVGLWASLPALSAIVVALPAGDFVQRRGNLVTLTNWGRMIFRTIAACFCFLPYVPPGIAPYLMVGARSLMSAPSSVVNVSVTTIWGRAVSPERRPRMLSTRWAINGLFAAGLGYVAGQWLDWAAYPLNYQVVFISGWLAGLGSVLVMRKLRLDPVAAPKERVRLRLKEMPALIKSEPKFMSYVIASFIFRLGLNLTMALYSIYQVRVLGCSDAWIGTLLTVQRLVGVGSYALMARFSSKPVVRRWLWLSCVGAALYPLSYALATTPEMLLIAAVVGGIFGSAMNVFMTDQLFQVSPADNRPAYVAINSLLANVAAFVAPLAGTAILGAASIQAALYTSVVLRVLGGFSFRFINVKGRSKR